jgi:lipopolysaccharide export system protein LptC
VQVGIPVYQAGMDMRFAAAARHSRMVRVLRVLVPTVVALSMGAIIAISIFNPFRLLTKLPLDVGNLVVSGTKITMESPHLSGFSPDQRPYEMWAKTATQDLTVPNRVELNTLHAKVVMEDRTIVTMEALIGLYDTKVQVMDLQKSIFLQSSTGYEARLSQARVDMANSTITSEEPVDVKLLNGTLTADKLRITEKGELVRFEGRVVMHLVMDKPAPVPSVQPAGETVPEPDPVPPQPTRSRSSSAKRANAK